MKYEGLVDLENRNNSHTFAVEMVGGNKRVLEFGCASGFVSQALRDRGCTVVGVELDPEFANQAKEFCDEVLVGDAESLDLETIFDGRMFDVATFGDVLEHMADPRTMLRRVRQWLVPEGFVVASLPNVAHGAVRLALLQGRFDYTPEGLLDETHVRFFTHDSVKKLFDESGFAVVETRRTMLGLFDTEIDVRAEDYPPELLAELDEDPEATTYQFVVKAVVGNAFSAAVEAHEREEAARLEVLRLQKEVDTLRGRSDALGAELAELHAARDADQQAIGALGAELEHLRLTLDAKDHALASHEEHWRQFEQKRAVRLYRRLQRLTGGS